MDHQLRYEWELRNIRCHFVGQVRWQRLLWLDGRHRIPSHDGLRLWKHSSFCFAHWAVDWIRVHSWRHSLHCDFDRPTCFRGRRLLHKVYGHCRSRYRRLNIGFITRNWELGRRKVEIFLGRWNYWYGFGNRNSSGLHSVTYKRACDRQWCLKLQSSSDKSLRWCYIWRARRCCWSFKHSASNWRQCRHYNNRPKSNSD